MKFLQALVIAALVLNSVRSKSVSKKNLLDISDNDIDEHSLKVNR